MRHSRFGVVFEARGLRLTAGLLAGLCALCPLHAGESPEGAPRTAVVALERGTAAVAASDFELMLAGRPAAVVGVEPLAPAPGGQPWQVLIYFDTPLSTPKGLAAAIRVLSDRAAELAALGPVSIVAADPEPRELVSGTRHAHEVRETLELFGDRTTLAGELLWRRLRFLEARRESRIDEARSRQEMERERALLERQRTALLSTVGARPSGGAGLLILVQDGFDLDFARFYLGSTERLEGLETDVDEAHAALCRAVAAAGWTAFGLALGEQGSEFVGARQPIRRLAEATGGELLVEGEAFARALGSLDRRVRLTYRASREPADAPFGAEIRPLEVRFRSRAVAAPRWSGRWQGPLEGRSPLAGAGAPRSAVRLLSPGPGPHAGPTRVTAITGEHEVDYVAFFLDGFLVDVARNAPFETRLDLGAEPAVHSVRAVAFSPQALELGEDSLRLNEEERPFRVEIVDVVGDPRAGEVDLRAEVSVPVERRLERVELYWNQELRQSLAAPDPAGSIAARLETGAPGAADHYRVVAYLDDGTSLEAARLAIGNGVSDRLDVSLVELYAMVTDRHRAPPADLTRDDFALFHAGRSRRIEGFARARDVPLTLGLAVDTSESMEPWQDDLRDAAATFFERALRPGDRAFLTDFDERARLTQGATERQELLVGRMGALGFGGTTSLYDAILFSLLQFEGQGGRKALVVLSDGKDFGSRLRPERCIREAQRLGVPIYMMVLERALEPLTDVERVVVRRLARQTGGQYHLFAGKEELAAIYARIEADLRSQYLLTYALDRPLTAADLGDIRVEVRDPRLSVRTILGRSVRAQ